METSSAEYPKGPPGKNRRLRDPQRPSDVLDPTAVPLIGHGPLTGIQIFPSVFDGFVKSVCLSEVRSAGGVDACARRPGAVPRQSPRFESLGGVIIFQFSVASAADEPSNI